MNLHELQTMIASNPEVGRRMILISCSTGYGDSLPSDAQMVEDILAGFGRDIVEDIEVVTSEFILVTRKDVLENLPYHLKDLYCFRKVNKVTGSTITYDLHHQRATVEGTLQGIPHLITASNVEALTKLISEQFPELSNVTVEYVPLSVDPTVGGHHLIKAMTIHRVTNGPLEYVKGICFEGFSGGIDLKIMGPILHPSIKKPPREVRDMPGLTLVYHDATMRVLSAH